MAKFRKKPVVIEAIQWRGRVSDLALLSSFASITSQDLSSEDLQIETLEGKMTAKPGDWIIRGVQGELYPCKDDIFQATYERAE